MPRRTPCIAAHAIFPISGRPRSPVPARHLRSLPELADQPYTIPVSFYTVSPFLCDVF